MAHIISGICLECLQPAWSFMTAHASYVCKFEDNLDELKNALEDLKAKRYDVLRRVNDEELKGGKRLDEVERWLSEAQTIETDTNLLVADASPYTGKVDNPWILFHRYHFNVQLWQKIPKMLDIVEKLSYLEVVAVQLQTFGLDTKLHSTWSLLMKSHVRMVGIYGMAGLGKTTLLTLINNKFVELQDEFDVVIWVKVSEDADISRIQDDIGKTLGLYDENWSKKLQREKAWDIHGVLQDRKPRFVLLLDDLWEEISLTAIGIPVLRFTYNKVVYTTRFRDACEGMEADEDIEVECLAETDAWDLFKLKARCSGLSDEISDIAKKIAALCQGLPRTLEVAGKFMASQTTEDEWRRALNNLESFILQMS